MTTPALHVGNRPRRRGFSLVELLIAVFILAIGLIMVITIFPVGGDWTRQASESTLSQTVAQNALAIIESRFPVTPSTNDALQIAVTAAVPPGSLVPFPGLTTTIPLTEMCYQFGATTPYPVADPKRATYFWSALVRASSEQPMGTTRKYEVFILVFKKGSPSHQYNGSDIPSVGIASGPPPGYQSGAYDPATGRVTGAVPPVGELGIGAISGTVFRQGTKFTTPGLPTSIVGEAKPALCEYPVGSLEPIYVATLADGTQSSPLVYVFQTTITRGVKEVKIP